MITRHHRHARRSLGSHGRQAGQPHAHARNKGGFAQGAAAGDFPLQIAHLALTCRAGSRAIALVVTLARLILDAIGTRNVKTDGLERIADMFTVFIHHYN